MTPNESPEPWELTRDEMNEVTDGYIFERHTMLTDDIAKAQVSKLIMWIEGPEDETDPHGFATRWSQMRKWVLEQKGEVVMGGVCVYFKCPHQMACEMVTSCIGLIRKPKEDS